MGARVNLPQFGGHFKREYTMKLKGVSNEKEEGITDASLPGFWTRITP